MEVLNTDTKRESYKANLIAKIIDHYIGKAIKKKSKPIHHFQVLDLGSTGQIVPKILRIQLYGMEFQIDGIYDRYSPKEQPGEYDQVISLNPKDYLISCMMSQPDMARDFMYDVVILNDLMEGYDIAGSDQFLSLACAVGRLCIISNSGFHSNFGRQKLAPVRPGRFWGYPPVHMTKRGFQISNWPTSRGQNVTLYQRTN